MKGIIQDLLQQLVICEHSLLAFLLAAFGNSEGDLAVADDTALLAKDVLELPLRAPLSLLCVL